MEGGIVCGRCRCQVEGWSGEGYQGDHVRSYTCWLMWLLQLGRLGHVSIPFRTELITWMERRLKFVKTTHQLFKLCNHVMGSFRLSPRYQTTLSFTMRTGMKGKRQSRLLATLLR